MKKLGKLTINPEKVIKNEELVSLRGGYDDGGYSTYQCYCVVTYEGGAQVATTAASVYDCGTTAGLLLSQYESSGATQVACTPA